MTTREKTITLQRNVTKLNQTLSLKRPTYSTSECAFGRVTAAIKSTATNSQAKTLS